MLVEVLLEAALGVVRTKFHGGFPQRGGAKAVGQRAKEQALKDAWAAAKEAKAVAAAKAKEVIDSGQYDLWATFAEAFLILFYQLGHLTY